MRNLRRGAGLLATAVAIALAGCSVESSDKADPQAGAEASPEAFPAPPAPAISPGVTDDEIKIGFVYPDLEKVRQYIAIDHGDYEATFTALVDKVNEAGGVNGRKLVPVFGAVNTLSPAGAQETCVRLTQDEKVFAVVGSLNADEPLCYLQTHQTAVIGGPLTAARYAKAKAPWFSDQRGGDEVEGGIEQYAAGGALNGKKVAVIATADDKDTVDSIVLPALKRAGVTPTEVSVVAVDLNDEAATNQQFNVSIEKFQTAGVDTVIVATRATVQFSRQLAKTAYRPTLLFTDRNSVASFVRAKENEPNLVALQNSTGIGTYADITEKGFAECARIAEEAIPEIRGKIVDPNNVPRGAPNYAISVGVSCTALRLFQAIAGKAGRDLTYQTFQEAGFSLGPFRTPAAADEATYGPQTPHGNIPPHLFDFDSKTGTFVLRD
ncbi:ABC transporter substrate-binding protein [Frankia sp. CNm7]|uniref:ABC transporter substrate-binding protein n=1 Tax=Frankia nepalensis TaxID=1836974 RepID=A0A937RSH6_9ACTN|nr:ABC transporter substrate-binding protein [Frankia nepalensis]MBL7497364.1 ABC transporter substrate-binding protein [Frankia nepalensis]MBL7510938.1 ABC transporter substrate-binding protein [Frankia nepalensis]MBL7517260.1 ABC transporter substrate-binding protein [Frankia nepalensis]MBL7631943.1 ABC transporter substrate-binding protein [Frankia nepalensis]